MTDLATTEIKEATPYIYPKRKRKATDAKHQPVLNMDKGEGLRKVDCQHLILITPLD